MEIFKLHPFSDQSIIIDHSEDKAYAEFQRRKLAMVTRLLETMGIDYKVLQPNDREKGRKVISVVNIPQAIYDTNKVQVTAVDQSREPLRYAAYYETKHQGLLPLKGENMMIIGDFFQQHLKLMEWANFDLGWDPGSRSVDLLLKGDALKKPGFLISRRTAAGDDIRAKIIGLRFIEDFHYCEMPIAGTVGFIALEQD